MLGVWTIAHIGSGFRVYIYIYRLEDFVGLGFIDFTC